MGRWVAAELVRDQLAGDTALALQQQAEESDRGAPIPSRLHQDVQDVAVLIGRSPQVLLPTIQCDEQLIKMPGVSETPAPLPEPAGIRPAERATPPSDRLIGDRNAPLCQEILDITETDAEVISDN